MNEELISQYVDRAGFASDTAFMSGQLKIILEQYNQLGAFRLKLNTDSTWKEAQATANQTKVAVDSMTQSVKTFNQTVASASVERAGQNLAKYKLIIEELNGQQKQYKAALDIGQISIDEYSQKVGKVTQNLQQYKTKIAESTQELKNFTAASFAAPNSITEARSQNKLITSVRNSTDVNDVEKIKELNDLLDRNNQLIDANSDKLQKQKINIGVSGIQNYCRTDESLQRGRSTNRYSVRH